MSTGTSASQAQASQEWGYSRGWRRFSVIVLRPLLMLVMKYRWQGQEYLPRTGGVILAPNHLSYADWPSVAWFSYVYGRRYPVFMIKSAVFEVKVLGPIMHQLGQLPVHRGRGDAGLVLGQAESTERSQVSPGRPGNRARRRLRTPPPGMRAAVMWVVPPRRNNGDSA